MIVEPASLHSRSRRRRLLRAVAVVLPLALLGVVVAAGVLGPKSATTEDGPPAADLASPSGSATAGAASPGTQPDAAQVRFPAAYHSLPALRPSQALAARASAAGPPSVLVVAGFLDVAASGDRCTAAWSPGDAWCNRLGTLSDAPFASRVGSSGGPPPHLHVTLPAGVVLPSGIRAGAAVPVVAIGQFEVPGSCAANRGSCEYGFVVERVVWVDGAEAALQPLREAVRGPDATAAPPETPRPDVLQLMAVLAPPTVVTQLDPVAGAVAARLKKGSQVIWYVRDVVLARDGSRLPRWVLLDPVDGAFLATAPSDVPPLPTSPAAPQG
jgi:hypothetical protein